MDKNVGKESAGNRLRAESRADDNVHIDDDALSKMHPSVVRPVSRR